jgi:hypothetical protein
MKSKDISYVIHKLVADYWLLSKEAAQRKQFKKVQGRRWTTENYMKVESQDIIY